MHCKGKVLSLPLSQAGSLACWLSRFCLLGFAPVMKSLLMCNLEQLDSDLKTNGSVSDEPINICYTPTTPFDKFASALFKKKEKKKKRKVNQFIGAH